MKKEKKNPLNHLLVECERMNQGALNQRNVHLKAVGLLIEKGKDPSSEEIQRHLLNAKLQKSIAFANASYAKRIRRLLHPALNK